MSDQQTAPNPTDTAQRALEEKYGHPRRHGFYALFCHEPTPGRPAGHDCGWITLKRGGPPAKCEACGSPSVGILTDESRSGMLLATHAEWMKDDEMAGMICTVADLRGRRVREHAEAHGLMVVQMSTKRWLVTKVNCYSTIQYKDGEHRGFATLDLAYGPADWQQTMGFIREKTPPLPAHLHVD